MVPYTIYKSDNGIRHAAKDGEIVCSGALARSMNGVKMNSPSDPRHALDQLEQPDGCDNCERVVRKLLNGIQCDTDGE